MKTVRNTHDQQLCLRIETPCSLFHACVWIVVIVGDSLPLALEWGLLDMVDTLATSMSSEDHSAVISLLRSIVALLRNGFFRDALEDGGNGSPRGSFVRDQSEHDIVSACNGAIRTKRALLVHLRYYLQYLYSVSPTEGTIFMDANALVPQVNKYLSGDGASGSAMERKASDKELAEEPPQTPQEAEAVKDLAPVVECVLCKYNVSGNYAGFTCAARLVRILNEDFSIDFAYLGHIHPGKDGAAAKPPPAKKTPAFTSTSKTPTGKEVPIARPSSACCLVSFTEKEFFPLSIGEGYFGIPGNPKSPVYREISTVRCSLSCCFPIVWFSHDFLLFAFCVTAFGKIRSRV